MSPFSMRRDYPPPTRPHVGNLKIGDRLICDEEADMFRPCDRCGSDTLIVAKGEVHTSRNCAVKPAVVAGAGSRWVI
jgi:hypothetical protein